jgi:hypothetical protein
VLGEKGLWWRRARGEKGAGEKGRWVGRGNGGKGRECERDGMGKGAAGEEAPRQKRRRPQRIGRRGTPMARMGGCEALIRELPCHNDAYAFSA